MSIANRLRGLAVAVELMVVAGACPPSAWAQVGSSTRLVLTESRAAVELNATLPKLDDFLLADSLLAFEDQRSAWDASWEVGASRGREARGAVYEALGLERLVGEQEALSRVLSLLRTEVEAIEAFEDDLPLHLSLSFREARGFLSQAEAAAEANRGSQAALSTVKTADALRELTPRAVALALIETAEGVLTADGDLESVTEENLTRARRLVLWARSAIRAGSHTLAVERAYYACRLAGVILP